MDAVLGVGVLLLLLVVVVLPLLLLLLSLLVVVVVVMVVIVVPPSVFVVTLVIVILLVPPPLLPGLLLLLLLVSLLSFPSLLGVIASLRFSSTSSSSTSFSHIADDEQGRASVNPRMRGSSTGTARRRRRNAIAAAGQSIVAASTRGILALTRAENVLLVCRSMNQASGLRKLRRRGKRTGDREARVWVGTTRRTTTLRASLVRVALLVEGWEGGRTVMAMAGRGGTTLRAFLGDCCCCWGSDEGRGMRAMAGANCRQ